MGNIENYKQRFYNLMESTMGDVKPLISEQIDYWRTAKELDSAMAIARVPGKDGDASQKEKIASILNRIESMAGWKELQRTFGKPNGQDLNDSLKRYLGTDYNRIMDELMSKWEKHGF
jgi:hypothetical protein